MATNPPTTAGTPARYLVCNADDFGLSAGINAGVARAHEHGVVTSASLMVRGDAAAEAAAYALADGRLGLGLHVDLGEWAFRDGGWVKLYEVAPLDDEVAVIEQAWSQYHVFRSLAGREPTHLDSHQHVHIRSQAASFALAALARRLSLPLRHCTPGIEYRGDLYSQTEEGEPLAAVTVEQLVERIRALPAGVTELGCHPGEGELDSSYGAERQREVELLCDPRVRAAVEREGITLCSFDQLPVPGASARSGR